MSAADLPDLLVTEPPHHRRTASSHRDEARRLFDCCKAKTFTISSTPPTRCAATSTAIASRFAAFCRRSSAIAARIASSAQSGHFDTGITAHPMMDGEEVAKACTRCPRPRRQRLRHRQQRPRTDQARMAEDHGSRPGDEGSRRHLPLRHARHAHRRAGAATSRTPAFAASITTWRRRKSSIRRSSRRTPGRSASTRCGWRRKSAWKRAAAASSAWAKASTTA